MANAGTLEVVLRDLSGKQVEDPGTEFTFFRMPEDQQIDDTKTLRVDPTAPLRFRLPAFPQTRAIRCRIAPTLYRSWEFDSQFFVLGAGETVRQEFKLARRPQRWTARFTHWDQLSEAFRPLKTTLQASRQLLLADNTQPRPFTDRDYDDVDDEPSILAKASLLNLYAKLTHLIEPRNDRDHWFFFVLKILRIARERLIAVARPELGDLVRFIRDNQATFRGEYSSADSSLHFKNFPAEFRPTFQPSDMFSIKSDEKLGNVQLTLAPAKDSAGNPVLLLDADIDENGDLLKHFFDLLKHRFTGGTHPFDIHEVFLLTEPNLDFGYQLVPA